MRQMPLCFRALHLHQVPLNSVWQWSACASLGFFRERLATTSPPPQVSHDLLQGSRGSSTRLISPTETLFANLLKEITVPEFRLQLSLMSLDSLNSRTKLWAPAGQSIGTKIKSRDLELDSLALPTSSTQPLSNQPVPVLPINPAFSNTSSYVTSRDCKKVLI